MLNDVIKIVEIHLERLKLASKDIEKLNSFKAIDLNNFEVIKTIDTFIFRFMKLQDYMGQKLFKVFLDEIGEYRDDMSMIDIIDKLEKLKILDNAEIWLIIRKLRNKLAHEYPESFDEIKEELMTAIEYYKKMTEIYMNIKNYLKEKGILKWCGREL